MDTFYERAYNRIMYTKLKGVCQKMAKKKVYDEDFKKMIVELYENKKPVAELKREYGLGEATLYRWIKEYGKIKVSNNETTTNHEIKRLKKELAQAKEENEILKKAVAIFTQK